MKTHVLFILLPLIVLGSLYPSLNSETALSGGITFKDLQLKAKTNACMRTALELLQLNCKSMTDDEQSRLAIMLANCHFQKSGKPRFPCEESMSILECTQNMTGDSWNTYTEFYTHAKSICFYMMSENWQENTEFMINSLTNLSLALAKDLRHELVVLNEIKKTQATVSSQISENLNMSLKAMNKYNELVGKYEQVGENVIHSYTALESILTQGKQQLNDIFRTILGKLDFVISLQEWLISQFFDIKAFLFYLSLGVAVFLATSFERTLSLRFPLLLLTTCNYFVEMSLVRCMYSHESAIKRMLCESHCDGARIEEIIKIERAGFLIVCAVFFLYKTATYQNYQRENNEILQELKKKLRYVERTPYWVHKYFKKRSQLEYNNTCETITSVSPIKEETLATESDRLQTDPGGCCQ